MSAETKFFKAKTIEEALQAAAGTGLCRFIAGGTDVMVNRQNGMDVSELLIDISGIERLKGIRIEDNFLHIGALTTLEEIFKSTLLQSHFPALGHAAFSVGSPVIRKSATLGGNLLCENRCSFYNQSEWWRNAIGYCLKCEGDICIATGGTKACFSNFTSDTAPVLLSLNATIEIASREGRKERELLTIYSSEGVNPFLIGRSELITQISIPLSGSAKTIFRKLRPRQSMDFSSLSMALTLFDDGKLKIVLGAVDPGPVVIECRKEESKEKILKEALKKSRIVDNAHYSRKFRREMIAVFIREGLEALGL